MLLVVDLLSGLRLLVTLPPPCNVIGGGSGGAEVVQLKCVLLRRVCGGIAVMDRVGRTVLQFDVLGRSMTTASDMRIRPSLTLVLTGPDGRIGGLGVTAFTR